MKNPPSGLQATFTRQGLRVERGKAIWGMKLAAFGTSGKLQPVAEAKPEANENRVEYRRGGLTEWYVNGPAGLEQGFTIATAPAGSASGTVELALRLTGNMTASVDAAKTGLILTGLQTSLRYTGLTARDAKGRKLRSWLEVRNGRLLVQVAAAGATYPLVVDPYVQAAKLLASDGNAYDLLGQSVSLSADGSTLVAYEYNTPSITSSAYAYVFTKSAGGWTQAAKLKPSEWSIQSSIFYQPEQVGVSGDGSTVVVGSWQANSGQGAVYVFARPPGGWANEGETATLTASGGDSSALGISVSISSDGSTVAAGALNSTGGVYVFVKAGDSWASENENALLLASDGGTGQFILGWTVGVSRDGSTVVAGEVTVGAGVGAAYVFDEPSGGWTGGAASPHTEDAKLLASDGATGDVLGVSVGVSGDGSTVVAGAPQVYTTSVGAAYVFIKPSGGWAGGAASPQIEAAKLVGSDVTGANPGLFGFSVGVNGDGSTVVAGTPFAVNDSDAQTGAVYVFTKPSGGWAGGAATPQDESSKLVATDGVAGDVLGASLGVSADGLTVAAGAPYATIKSNDEQGAAYVFTDSVPFSSFDAGKLRVTQEAPSGFTFNSDFVLGGASNGIDPATEPVTLQFGALALTIPAGSFHQQKNGDYVFSGVLEGVSLNAKFEYLGAYNWVFKANGSSPDALSITNPVTVTLTIGDDSGTSTETVPIN